MLALQLERRTRTRTLERRRTTRKKSGKISTRKALSPDPRQFKTNLAKIGSTYNLFPRETPEERSRGTMKRSRSQ